MENARYGITANCIVPGPIDTPLLRRTVEDGGDKLLQAMGERDARPPPRHSRGGRRRGRLLASREAGYITGEVLGVSGGMGVAAG